MDGWTELTSQLCWGNVLTFIGRWNCHWSRWWHLLHHLWRVTGNKNSIERERKEIYDISQPATCHLGKTNQLYSLNMVKNRTGLNIWDHSSRSQINQSLSRLHVPAKAKLRPLKWTASSQFQKSLHKPVCIYIVQRCFWGYAWKSGTETWEGRLHPDCGHAGWKLGLSRLYYWPINAHGGKMIL